MGNWVDYLHVPNDDWPSGQGEARVDEVRSMGEAWLCAVL